MGVFVLRGIAHDRVSLPAWFDGWRVQRIIAIIDL
jgi:hypothetical protein